jgi:HTH-type transcriptional regulator / antitoxin HigA
MEINPVRTEEDYEKAMSRIEELWGIPPDSPDSDELEILLALTGAFEKKHHRIESPDPVTLIEYRMEQMGLSQEEIRHFMESRKRLPEIISRESGLDIDVIKSFGDIPFEAFAGDHT